jgi:ribosome-associated toxin RatA of RatAB toxin-antitoxin module
MPILPAPCAALQLLGAMRRWGARSLAKCVVSCFLAVWAPSALASSAIDVHTSRQGDLIQVHAKAIIKAPMELVWATLTDYERLPEFIPGLKKSRIIARKGTSTTIEQSGVAQFLFLTVPIEVTLESTERAPHYIEVRRVAGTLRQLQGRYETDAMPELGYVQLRWTGSIEPENGLPPLVGESIMRRSIRSQFTGMVREIERREAVRKRPAPTTAPTQAALPSPPPLASPAAEPAASPTPVPASTPAQTPTAP